MRCRACSAEVNAFMAQCPSCGLDLLADPPDPLTHAPVDGAPVGVISGARRRRRLLMISGVLVAGGVAIAVTGLTWASSPPRASPPLAPAEVMADPLTAPSGRTGSVLVGVQGDRLVVVHLDAGVAMAVAVPTAGPQSAISSVIADGDTVVVLRGGPQINRPVWAFGPAALAGRAPPRLLGSGVTALPDAQRRVWIVSVDGGRYSAESVGLDGTGRTPPIAFPDVVPISVVAGGFLVESDGPSLAVWSPVSRTVVQLIGRGTSPISLTAIGRVVAWRDGRCFCAVHLFDAQTGQDRTVSFAPGLVGVDGDQAALSPDGSSLAFGLERRDNATASLGVIDVATGALSTRALGGTPAAVAWSPDGRLVFVDDGTNLSFAARAGGVRQVLGSFLPWAVVREGPVAPLSAAALR